MRTSPLAVVFLCVFAYGQNAVAQDVGQTVMLTQGNMQNVANAKRQPIQIIPSSSPETTTQPLQGRSRPAVSYAVADRQHPLPDCGCAKQPLFSANSGDLAPGTQVTITSPTPGATILYTTDDWTPTEASMRYTGPITINADTRLQAIAKEPGKLPSAIADAIYTVTGPQTPKPANALAVDGLLHKGTSLRLVTGATVTSETAQIGDRILLLLDENVMVGNTIVARKGSPVEATITRVDRAGRDGKPGVLAFQVQSLNAHGTPVPLSAMLTLAAPDPAAQAQGNSNASQVHVIGALPPGEEAEINPGMALTAFVVADITLQP